MAVFSMPKRATQGPQQPEHRRVLREHNATDPVRDGAKRLAGTDDRWPYACWRQYVNLFFDTGICYAFSDSS